MVVVKSCYLIHRFVEDSVDPLNSFYRSCRHEIETNYATIVKCLLEIKKNAVPCATELSNFSDLNLNSNYWKGLLPLKVMKQEICVPNSMVRQSRFRINILWVLNLIFMFFLVSFFSSSII